MTYISKEKLEEIKKELMELKTKARQEIAKKIADASKLGDLSENFEYTEAKEAQEFNERKIAELEAILRNAIVVDYNNEKKKNIENIVKIGSFVELKFNSTILKFQIVGSKEADSISGKISNESPLGSALLGKKNGDVVELRMPNGLVKKYKIKKIY